MGSDNKYLRPRARICPAENLDTPRCVKTGGAVVMSPKRGDQRASSGSLIEDTSLSSDRFDDVERLRMDVDGYRISNIDGRFGRVYVLEPQRERAVAYGFVEQIRGTDEPCDELVGRFLVDLRRRSDRLAPRCRVALTPCGSSLPPSRRRCASAGTRRPRRLSRLTA